jgi:hypothetical protein
MLVERAEGVVTFHVPERDRLTLQKSPVMGTDSSYGNNGAFWLPSPEPGWGLFLICSDGTDGDAVGELAVWEHVSVSARNTKRTRIPSWKEMCHVKDLCWDEEDVVVQFHPRASEYVNAHPDVLHMWRWKGGEFPTPPPIAVGPLPGDITDDKAQG